MYIYAYVPQVCVPSLCVGCACLHTFFGGGELSLSALVRSLSPPLFLLERSDAFIDISLFFVATANALCSSFKPNDLLKGRNRT